MFEVEYVDHRLAYKHSILNSSKDIKGIAATLSQHFQYSVTKQSVSKCTFEESTTAN